MSGLLRAVGVLHVLAAIIGALFLLSPGDGMSSRERSAALHDCTMAAIDAIAAGRVAPDCSIYEVPLRTAGDYALAAAVLIAGLSAALLYFALAAVLDHLQAVRGAVLPDELLNSDVALRAKAAELLNGPAAPRNP